MEKEAREESPTQTSRQASVSIAASQATSAETALRNRVAGQALHDLIRDNRVAAEGARLEGARPVSPSA